ncbi:MAG: PAS sensor protein [Alistipes sp.]|nr:PAS sensor protein [Alistipes sp.]
MEFENLRCPWGDTLKTCAITVCDLDGVVLYQNKRSVEVNGDVRGRSMIPCHSQRSREIIARLMSEGANNAYTISKRGLKKLIYQTPWYESGEVAGLVEFSLEIPEDMPHYVRE